MTTLLVVFVIVILLGISEGVVRLRQWLVFGHSEKLDDLFALQGDLRVLRPDVRTRTISINSLGFRGPPLTQPKPAGDLRIAFLGASTTFCAEVSGDNMTWPHLVSKAVQKKYSDILVDYVNAAVPGYTVKSSLDNFRRRVAALQPDVTIIYHATNDLSWETRSLALEQGVYEEHRTEERNWLLEHSQLWYLIVKNIRIKEVQKNAMNAKRRLKFSALQLGAKFREDLTQLVVEAQKVSAVVALVTFSHQIRAEQTPERQLTAAGSALYYMPFMTLNGLLDAFKQYNKIITDVAHETGAILIDAETAIPGDGDHFNDSVHFTDTGSIVMANIVSEALLNSVEFQALAKGKRSEK